MRRAEHAGTGKREPRRTAGLAALAVLSVTLVGAVVLTAAPVAAAVQYTNGDVFAGVGRGEIREFTPSGTLVQTLNTETDSFVQNGMCFDSADNLYATSASVDTMTKFGNAGNILRNPFGSGFTNPKSCVVDASGDVYVGQAATDNDDVLKFSSSGSLLSIDQATSPFQVPGRIALAADQCTLLYNAYNLVGSTIRRYDVCTDTQLADFARGLPSPCADIEIRPNGEVMLACSNAVQRLDPAGAVMQTYPVGSGLFSLSLDPDGNSFWTATRGGAIFRVNISSGSVLATFDGDPNTFLSGLAVFGEPPPGQPIGPEFGEIGIIDPISGTCGLKEPGESSVGITDRTAADIGSRLNVANCVANLITARLSGLAQEARFFGQAAFRFTQSNGFTRLKLVGQFFPKLLGSGASSADATAVTSGLRRKCRKPGFRRRNRRLCRRVLWGSGSGSYSTSGSYSSGTIRGTKWKTVDYVDQTTTFNKRGVVRVFDCAKKKKVVLKKGDKYVAKQNKSAKRGGRCGRRR